MGGNGEGVKRAEQGVSKVWRAENAALDIFKNRDKIWARGEGRMSCLHVHVF